MNKLENLAKKIYEECLADGEPVSKEEALEMAKMEIGAKDIKTYNQAEKPKKKSTKVRKVDEEKKHILGCIGNLIRGMKLAEEVSTKTETEVNFTYNGNSYTVKLVKHRPKK